MRLLFREPHGSPARGRVLAARDALAMVAESIPLALAAAVYPPAVVVLLVIMRREPFLRTALAYLAGAALMTYAAGVAIVVALRTTGLAADHVDLRLSGITDLVLAALLLLGAGLVARAPHRASRGAGGRFGRAAGSPRVAFVAGFVMYAPSLLYVGAVKSVADAGLGPVASGLWLLLLTSLVLLMVEVPLVLLIAAPSRTRRRLEWLDAWMAVHGRQAIATLAALGGTYLLVRGIVRLA
jgi:hypothetical protein